MMPQLRGWLSFSVSCARSSHSPLLPYTPQSSLREWRAACWTSWPLVGCGCGYCTGWLHSSSCPPSPPAVQLSGDTVHRLLHCVQLCHYQSLPLGFALSLFPSPSSASPASRHLGISDQDLPVV